jgi:hypothetical protein
VTPTPPSLVTRWDRLPYVVLAHGQVVDVLYALDFRVALAIARLLYGAHVVVTSAAANPYLAHVGQRRAAEADACEIVCVAAHAAARARRRAS